MAVSRAVKRGTLRASVFRDANGRPWITDVELADKEWDANTDYTDAPQRRITSAVVADAPVAGTLAELPPRPVAEDGETISSAAERQKHWQAKLAELKFREAAGELLLASDVGRKLEDVFRACRTKLLGLPTRAKQQLDHLSIADVQVLDAIVREALTELSVAEKEK